MLLLIVKKEKKKKGKKGLELFIYLFFDVGPAKISLKSPKNWLFWACQTHTS